ncbi:MAG TPA: ribonuclease HII [Fibrobacter sp.]|nr:ribonuclease HII [Fibrobacter sp.]
MKYSLPPYLLEVVSPIDGEKRFSAQHPNKIIIGVDEVGRGPLAGPVVACAAVLKNFEIDLGLNDSKKLSKAKRESLFELIKEHCSCYAIASASEAEIDELNILNANYLAMRRALSAIGVSNLDAPEGCIPVESKGTLLSDLDWLIAVDGNLMISGVLPQKQIPIIKGDSKMVSISAASVLAKVYRDRYMERLAIDYPGYGFEAHAGYGTKKHIEAIRLLGSSPVHRKSFHPKSLQNSFSF